MVARITSALPPGFIALLGINTVFLGLLFWFLDRQIDTRVSLVGKLIDACSDKLK